LTRTANGLIMCEAACTEYLIETCPSIKLAFLSVEFINKINYFCFFINSVDKINEKAFARLPLHLLFEYY